MLSEPRKEMIISILKLQIDFDNKDNNAILVALTTEVSVRPTTIGARLLGS